MERPRRRREPRRRKREIQSYRILVLAFLLAFTLVSCERHREPEVIPVRDVKRPSSKSASSEVAIAPPEADSARARTKAGSAVTPSELASLGAQLIVPVQGVMRSGLLDSYNDARGTRVHEALDIPAPRGTPVLSATDGRLLKLFNSKPGGLMVYATDLSERFILLYGHLDAYADGLSDGMRLRRGQVIGYVGTTGNAPPNVPHLHFGILRGDPKVSWSKGTAVNPYPLLVSGKPSR
jgi:murein DD-endopeptidase MepM/ murein hydrolase activator NlpD